MEEELKKATEDLGKELKKDVLKLVKMLQTQGLLAPGMESPMPKQMLDATLDLYVRTFTKLVLHKRGK